MAKLKTMTIKVKGEDGVEKDQVVALVGPKGHPIYEIDGKEVEQDIVELRTFLKSSNEENAARRISEKAAKEALAAFEGLDPVKAKEALTLVENFKDKDLVDAKKVEELKSQLESTWKQNLENQKTSYETKLTEATTALDSEKAKLKNLVIKNAFLGSDFLKGTIYDPVREDAVKIWADRFDIEEGENGAGPVVVMKLPDGNNFLSVATPGKTASFDEAIEYLIGQHPQKDHILRGSGASGSGAQGGGGGGPKTTLVKLKEQYATAQKNGQATEMMRLKDEIFALEQGGAT